MTRIFKLIKQALYYFPIDKQLHYLYGYKINNIMFFIILVIPFLTSTLRVWEIGVVCLPFTAAIAVLKEGMDKEIDYKDILATMYGGIFSSIQNCLLFYILMWTCRELTF